MNAIAIVDQALDQLVAEKAKRGKVAESFNAQVLAYLAGVSVEQMSTMLQQHRAAQETRPIPGGPAVTVPRYVVGCESYGPRGRWVILGKPAQDPKAIQANRVRHARWIARDTATRLARDIVCEVAPGLRGAQRDQTIDAATKLLRQNVDSAVQLVESLVGQP